MVKNIACNENDSHLDSRPHINNRRIKNGLGNKNLFINQLVKYVLVIINCGEWSRFRQNAVVNTGYRLIQPGCAQISDSCNQLPG